MPYGEVCANVNTMCRTRRLTKLITALFGYSASRSRDRRQMASPRRRLSHATFLTSANCWSTRSRPSVRGAIHFPEDAAIDYSDIPDSDRVWIGPVPVTSVRRTLSDCLHSSVAPELVAQASAQAAERGLITRDEVLSAAAVGLWRLRLYS